MDTAYDTIKYIKAFLQNQHSYPGPPTTPISQFSSPASREHLTPNLRAQAHATPAATGNASTANAISPDTMSNPPPEPPHHIPLKNPPIFYQLIHLTIQRKNLPQFHILHQVTLPDLNPLT